MFAATALRSRSPARSAVSWRGLASHGIQSAPFAKTGTPFTRIAKRAPALSGVRSTSIRRRPIRRSIRTAPAETESG